jgi:hypothetical protein
MPNSPDAIFREDEGDPPSRDPASETQADYQARTSTTILELRRLYGPHFAPGYGDDETLGHLLARAGLNTLDQYLERHHPAEHQAHQQAHQQAHPTPPDEP